MNLVQGGPTSIVIFRAKDVTSWTKVHANGKSSGQEYLRMPVSATLDGVDIIKFSPTNGVDLSSKRLYPTIDAGYTHISSASGWNGEVTYRRAAPRRDKHAPNFSTRTIARATAARQLRWLLVNSCNNLP